MRNLTPEERENLRSLLTLKPQIRNGYAVFVRNKKKFKRSRILMQLHLNKKLEFWEAVHHKDSNKLNDKLINLQIINVSEHGSLHFAGLKKPRKGKG